MTDVFTHPWLGGLFADPEAQAIWAADRQIAHMLAFEAAWSRALGAFDRATPEMAEHAARAIADWTPDYAILRGGTATDGLPVPALIRALKEVAGDAASAVHAGSTSQDVLDTALACTMREQSDLLERRLGALLETMESVRDTFGAARIMGRTRMQDALPIEARTRLQAWIQPFHRHRSRLRAVRERTEVVQIGGPVGDRRGMAGGMVDHVAAALGLHSGPCWHTTRDGLAEYAGLLSLIAGSCGKIGQDIALMAQAKEIGIAGGGRSSAMPHKSNPIRAEVLVTLARFAALNAHGMTDAMVHEQDRSGAAWMLEWLTLPPLALSTSLALDTTRGLIADIERIGDG